jgi:hypothetical protein
MEHCSPKKQSYRTTLIIWSTSWFLLFAGGAWGQASYQIGLLPALNINKDFKKGWAINAKWEARQLLQQGNFGMPPSYQGFGYQLSDISLLVAKKLGLRYSLASGYLIRLSEEQPVHRTMQQLVMLHRYNKLRMAHRLATDQTFRSQASTTWRLRYRFTSSLPLNGETADKRELYGKLNAECLHIFRERQYDLELRLGPNIGYVFSTKNKLELGFDYRANRFLQENTSRHGLWLVINWFVKL